jgi:hypothetical protein
MTAIMDGASGRHAARNFPHKEMPRPAYGFLCGFAALASLRKDAENAKA